MTYTQPVGLGRVVIYTPLEDDTDCRNNGATEVPATIVRTWEDSGYENNEVNLKVDVDGPQPAQWKTSVPYDETGKPGTWRWPAKK